MRSERTTYSVTVEAHNRLLSGPGGFTRVLSIDNNHNPEELLRQVAEFLGIDPESRAREALARELQEVLSRGDA